MEAILPYRFLFRFQLPCRYRSNMPAEGGEGLLDLPPECAVPNFAELEERENIGDVRTAWNERGLGISVRVMGKTRPPRCDPGRPAVSDGLQVWIDTRDTRTVHRATRFCHHFYFLPAGGGRRRREPVAGQQRIHRAREDARLCRPDQLLFSSQERSGGYLLEAFLQAEVLTGYDPSENVRLGFFYWLEDHELGWQSPSVGRDFPFAGDPSLWSVLELVNV